MIALAAMLLAAPSDWFPIGITSSALHIFVQRSSIHDVAGHRFARIRMGAAHAITGTIDLVYQDEEIDCRARRWRLLAFEARDARDHVVSRSASSTARGSMLPANPGTLGGNVVATVCALPPGRRN